MILYLHIQISVRKKIPPHTRDQRDLTEYRRTIGSYQHQDDRDGRII